MEVPENNAPEESIENIEDFGDDLFLEKETPEEAEDDLDFLEIDEPLEIAMDENEPTLDVTYDKVAAAEEIGIDLESFNELFDDFVKEGKLLIKDINTSIEERNIELWKRNALKLKGMTDNMRVDSFKEDLDTLIKTNDIETAKEAVDKIQASLEKISNL